MITQLRESRDYVLRIHGKTPTKIRLPKGSKVDILQTTRSVCLCSLIYQDDYALAMIESDNLDRREQQLTIRSLDSSVSLDKALANTGDTAWSAILQNYLNGCYDGKVGNLAWETKLVSITNSGPPVISGDVE